MNKQSRPSGAFKRKLKKERDVNLKKTNKVLDSYFAITSAQTQHSLENAVVSAKTQEDEKLLPSHSESKLSNKDESPNVYSEAEGKHAVSYTNFIPEENSASSSSESEVEECGYADLSTKNLSNFISPNLNDPITLKRAFLKQHPIQIHHVQGNKLPFNPVNLYYRSLPSGEKVQRKWLSYSFQLNKVFCSTCMACGGEDNRESSFITGHDVIHENSKYHQNSVVAALQLCKEGDIESYLNSRQAKYREKLIETRRQVLQCLVGITLFIGRQGLAYRGNEEAGYSLSQTENHGNFLELVLLISEYDVILKTHVEQCIEDSKKQRIKELKKNKKLGNNKTHFGRGTLVSFLSKTFINKLIKTIGTIGRQMILKDLSESIICSIMVDSTQDVAVIDQLAICVRYAVQGKVYERLLDLCAVQDSSGQKLFEKIKTDLTKYGIPLTNVVACSFDGAANMKGCYNGLQAYLKKENSNIIYTHCMAHVLNLVVADSTVNCLQTENLFGLVEETACFLSQSYKRMSVWTENTKAHFKGQEKLYRLAKIGATRWWSKHKALSSIVDFESLSKEFCFNDSWKLVNLFHVLLDISKGNFDYKTKFTARTLISQWTKFENIFTAFIILDLFKVTSPVSVFLQHKNIDYCVAWRLVESLLQQIRDMRGDANYDKLLKMCKKYTTCINEKFEDIPENSLPKIMTFLSYLWKKIVLKILVAMNNG